MPRPENPTNPPSESLKVDAAVVDPAHKTDLPTGEPVAEHTFGPRDVDTFPSQQRPHDIGALDSCLVLAPVELSDVLGSHQTGDAIDVSKPEPLEIDKRPQRDCGVIDPVSERVGKLLGEVLMTQPIEPQHHIDAVPSRCHYSRVFERRYRSLRRRYIDPMTKH